jgi:beta-1,2-mannobiose phosphorylase / 1,2-beta-oligomannan phosphorylase
MYFSDSSRTGKPMAKDPNIIFFKGKYFMYYSIPPNNAIQQGWGIGIATSSDLTNWTKAGSILPVADYERKGICAPGALVKDGKLHLFYQTYGNAKNDAICHAVSDNGIDFIRNPTNPIFKPTGQWTCGRAIDAEVIEFKGKYFMYFASRDTSYQYQVQGVASAPLNTSFNRNEWTQLSTDSAILFPTLPWEKKCVEGASCIVIGRWLYMFYAGGYNNEPQQIGIARSKDGVKWERLSDSPFLKNGAPGTWNESESGHPDIMQDEQGKYHLFFQGNNDKGKTWFLSKMELSFLKGKWVVE